MNKTSALSALAIAALALAAQAVPSGINYQGVLTDSQGQPVTGTRTMSIKLYDAATSGTPLYTEDLGTVSVTDGVFSFEFGTSGTSNAEQSDTVAITDGSASSFQKVLSAASVVAGSVSVSDGTYTWSQSGGSSNDDDFGVAYSTNLRRVTVTYFNGAPASGRTITATYRTPASGISGALAGDGQPWAEITVDGVAQVPRQKVLKVPFADRAEQANSVRKSLKTMMFPIDRFAKDLDGNSMNSSASTSSFLPKQINILQSMTLNYRLYVTSYSVGTPPSEGVSISFSLVQIDPRSGVSTNIYTFVDSIEAPARGDSTRSVVVPQFVLDQSNYNYKLSINIDTRGSQSWGAKNGASFNWASVDYLD